MMKTLLTVNNTPDKVEVVWDDVVTVVHDEDPPHIQLDIVLCLALAFEEIKWSSLGNKEKCLELKLPLYTEVFYSQVLLPVIGQGFVELSILLTRYVISIPRPDRLGLVQFLLLCELLLDSLLLGLLLTVCGTILPDILNLGFIFLLLVLISFFLLFFLLIVRHLPVLLLLDSKLDGVANELAVLLDHLLDLLLVVEVSLIFLHVQHNLRAPAQLLTFGVSLDGERPPCTALPYVLLIVVVLAGDGDLVSDEVGRVEADAKLANHGNVSTCGESLHESLCSRLGNSPEVVDHVCLGHP